MNDCVRIIMETQLNVPSGVVAVANDLREWFEPRKERRCSVKDDVGKAHMTADYAAEGLAMGFTGNSCPDVYRFAGKNFVVRNYPGGGYWTKNRVANITTDLWWYSICDWEDLERRMKPGSTHPGETFSVKPGVYLVRNDSREWRKEPGELSTYGDFEWIREPDPVEEWPVLNEAEKLLARVETIKRSSEVLR